MTTYRITPKAQRDLVAIGRYTRRKWGIRQRNAYITKLRRRIEWLAGNPRLGTARDDVESGYLSYPEGEHLIFYIAFSDRIDIIGLPHRMMDIARYFGANADPF